MFRLDPATREARRYRRKLRSLPQDMSPYLLRDIGIEPDAKRNPVRWPQLW